MLPTDQKKTNNFQMEYKMENGAIQGVCRDCNVGGGGSFRLVYGFGLISRKRVRALNPEPYIASS